MEEIERNEIISIEYETPKFAHRVLANLIDILIFVLIFISLFIASRNIANSTDRVKQLNDRIDSVQLASCLYVDSEDQGIVNIISYLDSDSSNYGSKKVTECKNAINGYIEYLENNISSETSLLVKNAYDEFRLDPELLFSGDAYFILDGDTIIDNPECTATKNQYYTNVYKVFINDTCLPSLSKYNKSYLQDLTDLSITLLLIECPASYLLAGILTYYVPPLFFRRGRKTLGKALYHIGLVGPDCLSISFKRFTARQAIFIFAELVLSLFTFGIPYIVSFSLMAFSKSKKGFPDYMLGSTEITTVNNKIYFSKDEIALEKADTHKKAVDFKMEDLQ